MISRDKTMLFIMICHDLTSPTCWNISRRSLHPWEKFHNSISQFELYAENDSLVDKVLHDLQTQKITDCSKFTVMQLGYLYFNDKVLIFTNVSYNEKTGQKVFYYNPTNLRTKPQVRQSYGELVTFYSDHTQFEQRKRPRYVSSFFWPITPYCH